MRENAVFGHGALSEGLLQQGNLQVNGGQDQDRFRVYHYYRRSSSTEA